MIGGRYFISKNDGLQTKALCTLESLCMVKKRFMDPNTLSENGTVTAHLSGASKDSKYVVVVRNEAGSDWQQLRVLDVAR